MEEFEGLKLTQVLVEKLTDMGYSKYRLAKVVGVTDTAVDFWANGTFEARSRHLAFLQDLYNEKCRELRTGLYAPPKKTRKKELDNISK